MRRPVCWISITLKALTLSAKAVRANLVSVTSSSLVIQYSSILQASILFRSAKLPSYLNQQLSIGESRNPRSGRSRAKPVKGPRALYAHYMAAHNASLAAEGAERKTFLQGEAVVVYWTPDIVHFIASHGGVTLKAATPMPGMQRKSSGSDIQLTDTRGTTRWERSIICKPNPICSKSATAHACSLPRRQGSVASLSRQRTAKAATDREKEKFRDKCMLRRAQSML